MIGLLDVIFKIHLFVSVEDGHQIPGNKNRWTIVLETCPKNLCGNALSWLYCWWKKSQNNHLGCIRPCKEWDKRPINWLAVFLPSTLLHPLDSRELCQATFINMSQTQISYILPNLTWLVDEFNWSGKIWVKQQVFPRLKRNHGYETARLVTLLLLNYIYLLYLRSVRNLSVNGPLSFPGHQLTCRNQQKSVHQVSWCISTWRKIPYNQHTQHTPHSRVILSEETQPLEFSRPGSWNKPLAKFWAAETIPSVIRFCHRVSLKIFFSCMVFSLVVWINWSGQASAAWKTTRQSKQFGPTKLLAALLGISACLPSIHFLRVEGWNFGGIFVPKKWGKEIQRTWGLKSTIFRGLVLLVVYREICNKNRPQKKNMFKCKVTPCKMGDSLQ